MINVAMVKERVTLDKVTCKMFHQIKLLAVFI